MVMSGTVYSIQLLFDLNSIIEVSCCEADVACHTQQFQILHLKLLSCGVGFKPLENSHHGP